MTDKKMCGILLYFLAILTFSSCVSPYENYTGIEVDTLPYSKNELLELKEQIRQVDSLFMEVHRRTNTSLDHLGFIIGDSIHYFTCLSSERIYIPAPKCNFEEVLGKQGNTLLLTCLDSLRSKKMYSCGYFSIISEGKDSLLTYDFMCTLDLPIYQDERSILFDQTGLNVHAKLVPFDVLDENDCVYLLKDKFGKILNKERNLENFNNHIAYPVNFCVR